jgi:tripartite-type tricarboxylate transporter receptor subunit TctC
MNLATPFGAGETADHGARFMRRELSRLVRMPVIISNHSGADSFLGTQSVTRAAKDGCTSLYAQNILLTIRCVTAPQIANSRPLRDLPPLKLATYSPSLLVVHR